MRARCKARMRDDGFALRVGNEFQVRWRDHALTQADVDHPSGRNLVTCFSAGAGRSAAGEIPSRAADRGPGIQRHRIGCKISKTTPCTVTGAAGTNASSKPPRRYIRPIRAPGRRQAKAHKGFPPSAASCPAHHASLYSAKQYNDYIFTLCMRITHEEQVIVMQSQPARPDAGGESGSQTSATAGANIHVTITTMP